MFKLNYAEKVANTYIAMSKNKKINQLLNHTTWLFSTAGIIGFTQITLQVPFLCSNLTHK